MKRHVVRHAQRVALASIMLALGPAMGAAHADVVAVVSSKSPITNLSKAQVVDIFLGRRTRYPDGTSAVPIDQAEGATARERFYSLIADMSPAQVKAYWSKIIFTGRGQPPLAAATSLETKKMLLANPNAISYLDESLVDSSVRAVLLR
jgi:ABC-type phosphate transport system substrate-binding protein